jgi:TRAP-type mannitol/chloroaromatic compound transport system permease large subunit
MLITVPVFVPVAAAIGLDPLAFAILGILAIEAGLLTPPFGILVFTVKAALPEEKMTVGEMFMGAIPYWIALLVVTVCVAVFPKTATWLPSLVF